MGDLMASLGSGRGKSHTFSAELISAHDSMTRSVDEPSVIRCSHKAWCSSSHTRDDKVKGSRRERGGRGGKSNDASLPPHDTSDTIRCRLASQGGSTRVSVVRQLSLRGQHRHDGRLNPDAHCVRVCESVTICTRESGGTLSKLSERLGVGPLFPIDVQSEV